jgi:ATP-binding cassette subfamily B protein
MFGLERSMKQKLAQFKQLAQAVRLVWQSAPGWTVVTIIVVIVQGLLPALSLYLTKMVVDTLAQLFAQPAGAREFGALLGLLPLVLAVFVVGRICSILSTVAKEAQSTAVTNHVQCILQDRAIQVDYQCYEDPTFHNTMLMAHGEAMTRPTRIVYNLTQSAGSALSLVAVTGVLLVSHAYLVPIVILAALPGTVARILNSRALHAWRIKHMQEERYSGYLNTLLTTASFAKEVRVFGHGRILQQQCRRIRDRLRKSQMGVTRKRVTRETAADALSYVLAGGGVAIFLVRMKTGTATITMGDLALLFQAFQKAKGALTGWLSSLTSLYEDALFIRHYYDFMALPQRIGSPPEPKPLPSPMRSGIRVEGITFRYPGTQNNVLSDVSLSISPGEHVALVGQNGSGKTTLAKLMCRLYDPDDGRITIDGTDIRDVAIEELRSSMGVLFQDYARYFMTAGENIRIGDNAIPAGDARIRESARLAGADTVIADLPQGYDTMLGRLFEGGVELSVGQWQRIALARSLVRDAEFVLLDEHTSALDPKAEHEVLHQLFDSVKSKTVMIISHRLSTVTLVDRIIMLAHGRVVEQGSHDELMRSGGQYAELFSMQAEPGPQGLRDES